MSKENTVEDTKPWWSFGHVWLIISGPAIVVVAALITGWIAMKNPDPVLAEDYYRRGIEINKTLSAGEVPATQARNHAATATSKP